MAQVQVVIEGTGCYLPERVLTNDDLSKMVDTSDEWIRTRTGIAQRHIAAPEEACSDLAYRAAQQAIQGAHLQPIDIDAVLVATVTPDMPFPSTAALLQHRLGLRCVMALDINAACSGFLYGLELARHLLQSACYRHVLLIGSDKLSSIVNWGDRRTCVLFGDGAGAFVLGKADAPASDPSSNSGTGVEHSRKRGCLVDCVLGADGSNPEWLCMPAGGSRRPATPETVDAHLHTIHMNGAEVFKAAVRRMADGAATLLQRNHLSVDAITHIVPHQANLRIIQALAHQLSLPMERFLCNVDQTGNTSAASIPIAFAQAEREGRFRPNAHILLVAFGGGLTWGAVLLRY